MELPVNRKRYDGFLTGNREDQGLDGLSARPPSLAEGNVSQASDAAVWVAMRKVITASPARRGAAKVVYAASQRGLPNPGPSAANPTRPESVKNKYHS